MSVCVMDITSIPCDILYLQALERENQMHLFISFPMIWAFSNWFKSHYKYMQNAFILAVDRLCELFVPAVVVTGWFPAVASLIRSPLLSVFWNEITAHQIHFFPSCSSFQFLFSLFCPSLLSLVHENVGILTLFSELKGGLNPTPFHALMWNTSLSIMMSTETFLFPLKSEQKYTAHHIQVFLHAVVLKTCDFLASFLRIMILISSCC